MPWSLCFIETIRIYYLTKLFIILTEFEVNLSILGQWQLKNPIDQTRSYAASRKHSTFVITGTAIPERWFREHRQVRQAITGNRRDGAAEFEN